MVILLLMAGAGLYILAAGGKCWFDRSGKLEEARQIIVTRNKELQEMKMQKKVLAEQVRTLTNHESIMETAEPKEAIDFALQVIAEKCRELGDDQPEVCPQLIPRVSPDRP